MRRDTSDSVIYFVIRKFSNKEAIAIGTCSLGGEVKLDMGHIVRPISKAEYDSYIALDLFPQYNPKYTSFIWRDLYGDHGSYFGVAMHEEERKYASMIGTDDDS